MRVRSVIFVAVAALMLAPHMTTVGLCADTACARAATPAVEPPKDASPMSGAEPPPPPPALVLDPVTVQSVLGREVRSIAGENMGRIVDIIVDRSGQVRAAVIDFGGFLGVGSRKIAVDWSMLRFGAGEKSDRVTLDLTRNQVKAAPEYKEGKPIIVLGATIGIPPAEPTSAPAR